ncbi:MAG TPA: hypothetical protein VGJ46_10410 [Candidatus Limnocylindrales bacterium]
MPEILTESFCERCGTRYTFESGAPKQRKLGRFKVLSQGLKNFVMSDDASLDEAFAAARSDEEREAVAQQLDAFHKAFNFCMNCRQYTCGNCWNEVEGRCLTCAPQLGQEFLQAPFAGVQASGNGAEEVAGLEGLAWPPVDLPVQASAPTAWPEADVGSPQEFGVASRAVERSDGLPDWATLVPHSDAEAAEAMPAETTAAEATSTEAVEPEPIETEAVESVFGVSTLEDAAEQEQVVTPTEAVAEPELAATPDLPGQTTGTAETVEAAPTTLDQRAATAAAQTAELLARFRPGQSIDEALEAYEASLGEADTATDAAAGIEAAAEREAEPVVATEREAEPVVATEREGEPVVAAEREAEPVIVAEPEAVVAAEPEPVVVAAEAEPVATVEPRPEPMAAVQPEPVAAVEPEPVAAFESEPTSAPEPIAEPEPLAATAEPAPLPEPEPEPAAASEEAQVVRPASDDRVEVPVWRIVAPETPAPAPTNGQPAEAPQWPPTPTWPGQDQQVDVSFLAARLSRTPANDALWAASSRDVMAPLPQQAAVPAIQTCVSCGLSLSATARFCRRCGSRQGG